MKVKENGMVRIVPGKPKEALESILKQYRSPQIEGLPTFTGGLVGYFSYEMIQYAEPKLKIKQNDVNDFELMMFDKLIAFDQMMHKLVMIVNAKTCDGKAGYDKAVADIEAFIETLRITDPIPYEKGQKAPEFTCNLSKEEYCGMVEKTNFMPQRAQTFPRHAQRAVRTNKTV